MKMFTRLANITLILPFVCAIVLICLLQTNYYGYFIYLLLGFVFYLLIKCLGREVSFLFFIPVLIIGLVLVGHFFILDFYNNNDMNPLKVHPFVLAWLIAFFVHYVEDMIRKKIVVDKIVFMSLFVLIIFLGVTFAIRGISGASMFIHNYLGPISLFLFFYNNKRVDVNKVNAAVKILIGCSIIIGLFGIYEYMTNDNILEPIYFEETPVWTDSTDREGYRIKTTIGHPLDNAVFFLFSMILVQMKVQNVKLKYALLLLFIIDILLTGSRSMFALSFLIFLFNNQMFSRGFKQVKQHFIKLVLAGLVILVVVNTSLGATFMNRVAGATDSTEARFMLIDYFFKHIFSFQMMGLGGASADIKILDSFNNPIILENPWIILFFDVGYLLVFYIILLFLILSKIKHKFLIAILILAISGYNSFGVKSNANYFLFYLFSYSYVVTKMTPGAIGLKASE